MPSQLTTAGSMYVITPHGGDFQEPVEVSIPVPNVTLRDTQELKLAKAEPGGEWTILGDSTVVDGKLRATVDSFSFFTGVIISYTLPIAQAVPYAFSATITCEPTTDCLQLVGPTTLTYTVTGNGGQLPLGCVQAEISGWETTFISGAFATVLNERTMPSTGGSVTRTMAPPNGAYYEFGAVTRCRDANGSTSYLSGTSRTRVEWKTSYHTYPSVSVVSMPTQTDVVDGMPASIDAILMGGAVRYTNFFWLAAVPTATDHVIVDWLRSDDGGASWRNVGRSFQHEANAKPYGTGVSWSPWSVRHGFVATSADQGALVRVNACYTPPAPTVAPPCVAGPATRLNVLQQSALPAIAEQPRSVLVRSAETANFSVSVSGLPAPTLQWQTRPANSTGVWTDVNAGTGPMTASYTTPPRMLSDNGVQYRVVVTNALGSVTSTPVTVSVSDLDVAPSITTQPASLSVTSGIDAVFAAVVHGTEALSYQWRFNGTNIDGANSPVLRLTGVTNSNAGSYSLYASNSAGNVTSNAATLQVTVGTPAAVAPSIVTQPSPVTVNAGNTATLAVGVAGTGPFTFQWRRDGADVSGATSAVLTFNSVALPNAGSYSVRVTNSAGTVVSNAVPLDVTSAGAAVAPTITSQPATLIVPLNGSGVIAVGATGSGPMSYQWYLDGVPLPGSTLPVLNFSHVGSVDFGTYTVTVTNSVSSVTSQPADLILLGAPVITQQPAAATVLEGANATFFVAASGSGLRYQWSVNGTQIPGAIAATFNTPSLVAANSGAVYSVLVYNGAGHVVSQSAVLTVQTVTAPSIIQHPANVTIQPGAQAEMCVTIGGTPTFDVQLQRWNGSSWSPGVDVLVNHNTQACYFTDALTLADNGAQFRFFIRNPAGDVLTNAATVTVMAPPPTGITDLTLASPAHAGGVSNHNATSPSISANGRYVAFNSFATDLIAGFPQPPVGMEQNHAYLRDLVTGTTTLINQTTTGGVSTHDATNLKLSANGRYAVFSTLAGDQVAGDNNGSFDVFRRDLLTGTTVAVNVLPNGELVHGAGNASGDLRLSISGDGRFVTFMSTNDVATGGDGESNDGYFLYVRDMQTGTTRYVDGTQGPNQVMYVAMADDGGWIAYEHYHSPTDMVSVVLYDIAAHSHHTVYNYVQGTFPAGSRAGLSVSADGRYVVFALNGASITGSTQDQILLVDRENIGGMSFISTGVNGLGDGSSTYPRISGDGRYVLFETIAPNLTGGQALPWRRFPVVHDRDTGTTSIASHRLDGAPTWVAGHGASTMSSDGSTVVFVAGYGEIAGGGLQQTQIFAEPRL